MVWACNSGHTWSAPLSNRTQGSGCPYCTGKKTLKDKIIRTIKHMNNFWQRTLTGSLFVLTIILSTVLSKWSFFGLLFLINFLCLLASLFDTSIVYPFTLIRLSLRLSTPFVTPFIATAFITAFIATPFIPSRS
jgi:hypothetical protein